jgi:hypothetical protein
MICAHCFGRIYRTPLKVSLNSASDIAIKDGPYYRMKDDELGSKYSTHGKGYSGIGPRF